MNSWNIFLIAQFPDHCLLVPFQDVLVRLGQQEGHVQLRSVINIPLQYSERKKTFLVLNNRYNGQLGEFVYIMCKAWNTLFFQSALCCQSAVETKSQNQGQSGTRQGQSGTRQGQIGTR